MLSILSDRCVSVSGTLETRVVEFKSQMAGYHTLTTSFSHHTVNSLALIMHLADDAWNWLVKLSDKGIRLF